VKLNMVVFEPTAGYVPEMVNHVAANPGLRLQLIEYMPELAGRPEWAIDIDRVHDWLEGRATEVETREMHDRRRYWVESDGADVSGRSDETDAPTDGDGIDRGMVEVVDPVGNAEFCANCHRIRVTHDGYLKGCLNRNDDLRSLGDRSREAIDAAIRETVANRVPYYGEYMIKDDEGEWVMNDAYLDAESDRDPYEYDADDTPDGTDPDEETSTGGSPGEGDPVASDD
jgi:cyclic pyranopterin phosphate synthase